ncbi:MAG: MmcQ/YjbR family DNA-binding protein [Rothia sp. (in: high G+C Gram-positive bacteria)]|uniref:MmcQ/YjbR family DNA-binding protein n=1 Tax=Rothia sp. (in: high G+C Gram-positive bacteria) TaxID=1885016 RepID=UPI0026E0A1FE|nr:MmcQ/YjbR family DNA-binding protein [Rothia sp. (in: high G+C Gram-positive bacteria)]MDO5750917.1 MmcQ/YjbR family DNA-binding protein [Rothia sp. (in: high G+C Gram-positive bacteria)]
MVEEEPLTAGTLHEVAAALAMEHPLVTVDSPFGRHPEVTVYRVGGKIFAMTAFRPTPDGAAEPIVNLKTDPDELAVLLRIYPSVSPAWHMSKRHWISVAAGPGMDRDALAALVEDAYLRIMYALPKHARPVEFRAYTPPTV